MNIVLRELRAHLKSLIIWSVSMVFLILVGMVKYAGIAAAGQSVNDLFNQIPDAMKSILRMNSIDLTSISGFYAIFFLYFMLLGSVHASLLGAVIISKEERDKTADFLLVKPVMRSKIITAKLVALLINLVVFNIVTLVSSIIIVGKYNTGESINTQIIKLMVGLFVLQIIFASIGAVISVTTRKTKKATSISTTFILITFILSVAIDLYDKIDFLKYFTPFKYFNAANVMNGASYDIVNLLLSAIIVIGCIAFTYLIYNKRDVHI